MPGRCTLRTFLLTLGLVVAAGGGAASAQKEQLGPGDVLGKGNWQLAEGLLPPEILKHYREDGYRNEIVDWPADHYDWPPDFVAGSKKNEGRFEIGAEGQIVDKETGKQPDYILGFPFPDVEADDSKAASKILWNFFYRTWYFGNLRAESQVNWVKPSGLERRTDQEVNWQYYDGIPEKERAENPQNFSMQYLAVVVSPTDLNGTSSLTWRYRSPNKRDNTWAYVPALRRVRAISPANRSDGFLGSDMSEDDGPFFDGKPEAFTWTLKGTADQLRLVDPLNLQGKWNAVWLKSGGWRANWPDLPFIGYMDDDWKGLGWAPRTGALAKRTHWVIEGVPNDRYYLYGKLELWIDKVTYQGSWSRKFGWNGDLLTTYQVMSFVPAPFERPDGGIDYLQGSNMAFQCAENIKVNQATVAGIKSSPKSGFDTHITYDPGFFDMTALSRFGK